ncbi:putative Ethanolamine kinase [Spironucleus salmonicida]|uniref:Ethanolamine kinase n=1 Tax=Spironucleus salmonicida TaxID=348837 RepID=V6LSE8_9EUKA|nr:putative Ethanolamine kinase [Spironucleus salmonicida]|eukprot:EST43679.1 Ethanolamine kinase, putative [Spironucleus salmonicida]
MLQIQNDFADVQEEIAQIEKSISQQIKILERVSGCTNDNFIVQILDQKYLLRRYLKREEIFMRDQDKEIQILQYLISQNCQVVTEELIHFDAFFITKYIEGSLLEQDSLLGQADNLIQIATAFQKLHQHQIGQKPSLFDYIPAFYQHQWYYEQDKETFDNFVNFITQQINFYKTAYPHLLKVCICHNDAHAGNIIFNNNQAYFIDFEYASVSYNFYDIACFFAEFTGIDAIYADYATLEQRTIFYKTYFTENVDITICEEILAIFQPFVWGLWSLWGSKAGYELYAKNRLQIFKIYFEQLK